MRKISICSFLIVLGFVAESQASTRVGFVGAYQSTVASISSSSPTVAYSPSASAGYGAGALLYLGFFPGFEIETGALYIQRKVSTGVVTSFGPATEAYTFSDIQIPLQLRFSLIPLVSFGAGIVYNIGVGNLTQDQTDGTAGSILGGNFSGKSVSYSAAQFASTDLAYDLSVEGRIPLPGKWGIFANVNYQIGAANIDTSSSTNTKLNVLQILAGVSMDLL